MNYFVFDLLFISGGAYRPGDLEFGRSQAPILGSLMEEGVIGLISCGVLPPSVFRKSGFIFAALSTWTSSASVQEGF